jgi:hypothetical protein
MMNLVARRKIAKNHRQAQIVKVVAIGLPPKAAVPVMIVPPLPARQHHHVTLEINHEVDHQEGNRQPHIAGQNLDHVRKMMSVKQIEIIKRKRRRGVRNHKVTVIPATKKRNHRMTMVVIYRSTISLMTTTSIFKHLKSELRE